MTAAVRILVAGEPVDGRAGQTIAAVLLDGGHLAWRRSRTGRPRGVFCGIGVCFDCLVEVNGLRDVRACLRRAADGDRVEFQDDGPPPVAEAALLQADGTEADRG